MFSPEQGDCVRSIPYYFEDGKVYLVLDEGGDNHLHDIAGFFKCTKFPKFLRGARPGVLKKDMGELEEEFYGSFFPS